MTKTLLYNVVVDTPSDLLTFTVRLDREPAYTNEADQIKILRALVPYEFNDHENPGDPEALQGPGPGGCWSYIHSWEKVDPQQEYPLIQLGG